MPLHRWAYNTGAGTAACAGASATMQSAPNEAMGIVAGIAAFIVINLSMVAAAIVAAGHTKALVMLRNPRTHVVVVVTQLLGASVGELMTWRQPAGLLVLPALYAFHVWAARGTVEDTKSFDTLTGLWTEAAWLALAHNAMAEHRWFSILMVDVGDSLDRSAVVNELRARRLLQPDDSVGCHADPTMVAVMLRNTPVALARMLSREIAAEMANAGHALAIGTADSRTASSLPAAVMHAYSDAVIQRAHSTAQFR